MVWDKCSVKFNTGITGSFYTGDTVTGCICIQFKNNIKLEYITCKIVGICKAQWTRSMPTIPYIKIYSEKMKVLDIQFHLLNQYYDPSVKIYKTIPIATRNRNVDYVPQFNWKFADKVSSFRTDDGKLLDFTEYTQNFQYILPEDLPSTFKNSMAKVQYYMKVDGKAVNKFKKKERALFNVVEKINLNNIESYMTPIYTTFSKNLWKSGHICVWLKTYQGFAPTQKIPFEIVINNKNLTIIKQISVSLVQKLEYNLSSGHADNEKTIIKSSCDKFSRTNIESCHFHMVVPEIVPSTLNQVNPMVKISYVLRLEVVFPFHLSMCEDVPVIVASDLVMHYDNEYIMQRYHLFYFYTLITKF